MEPRKVVAVLQKRTVWQVNQKKYFRKMGTSTRTPRSFFSPPLTLRHRHSGHELIIAFIIMSSSDTRVLSYEGIGRHPARSVCFTNKMSVKT